MWRYLYSATSSLLGPISVQVVPTTLELTVTITGLDLTTDVPSTVLLQPRQNANQDFGFPDLFSVMLITTARDHLVVRIARQDQGGGWGQDLRLDILIVDSVNNP